MGANMPDGLRAIIADEIEAEPDQVYLQDGLQGVVDLKQLIVDDRPDLLFPLLTPRFPERFRDFVDDGYGNWTGR
jgi:polyphosphate kinase